MKHFGVFPRFCARVFELLYLALVSDTFTTDSAFSDVKFKNVHLKYIKHNGPLQIFKLKVIFFIFHVTSYIMRL